MGKYTECLGPAGEKINTIAQKTSSYLKVGAEKISNQAAKSYQSINHFFYPRPEQPLSQQGQTYGSTAQANNEKQDLINTLSQELALIDANLLKAKQNRLMKDVYINQIDIVQRVFRLCIQLLQRQPVLEQLKTYLANSNHKAILSTYCCSAAPDNQPTSSMKLLDHHQKPSETALDLVNRALAPYLSLEDEKVPLTI